MLRNRRTCHIKMGSNFPRREFLILHQQQYLPPSWFSNRLYDKINHADIVADTYVSVNLQIEFKERSSFFICAKRDNEVRRIVLLAQSRYQPPVSVPENGAGDKGV